MRKHVPVLKAVKNKLQQINSCTLFINTFSTESSIAQFSDTEEKIQKIINGMAVKMHSKNQRGCYYIEAINEYIAVGAN